MNDSLWTPEQHQWLRAMGHSVWQVATPGADIEASAPADDRDARREAAELLRQDERPQRRAPVSPPARAATPAPDRLLAAVSRAARRAPGDADVIALLPDVAALRGNAAAKRALWPRLRALRRTERSA